MPVRDHPYLYLPRVWKGLDGPLLARGLQRLDTREADVLDAHFGYPAGFGAVRLGAGARPAHGGDLPRQ